MRAHVKANDSVPFATWPTTYDRAGSTIPMSAKGAQRYRCGPGAGACEDLFRQSKPHYTTLSLDGRVVLSREVDGFSDLHVFKQNSNGGFYAASTVTVSNIDSVQLITQADNRIVEDRGHAGKHWFAHSELHHI